MKKIAILFVSNVILSFSAFSADYVLEISAWAQRINYDRTNDIVADDKSIALDCDHVKTEEQTYHFGDQEIKLKIDLLNSTLDGKPKSCNLTVQINGEFKGILHIQDQDQTTSLTLHGPYFYLANNKDKTILPGDYRFVTLLDVKPKQ